MDSLISSYEWAGVDSITFNDGRMVLLDIEFYSKNNYFIGPIADATMQSYLKYNSEELSSFDVFSRIEFDEFEILAGDGSSEGNGVVYVLNKKDKSLVWFAFFENSEAFIELEVDANRNVNAKSRAGIIWKILIEDPLQIELVYPN